MRIAAVLAWFAVQRHHLVPRDRSEQDRHFGVAG
jgi:hypothetical protein